MKSLWLGVCLLGLASTASAGEPAADRVYCVSVMTRIARPVLTTMAEGWLHRDLPDYDWQRNRTDYAGLEALGRTLAGIAPWLELGPDQTEEGKLRAEFIELSVKAIADGTDPKSPDFLNFTKGGQPLVDAAFLAQGLLDAPKQLRGRMDATPAREPGRCPQSNARHHARREQLVACGHQRGIRLDQAVLSRIESRTRSISDHELIAIARCLKVSVGALCGERNRKNTPA